MKPLVKPLLSAVVLAGTLLSSPLSLAENAAKTAVLVHGAFADGSAWNKVIPLLREQGLNIVSVQLPLHSLQEDVEYTQRAINNAQGPVVLVGHSWGGMVITDAGVDDKVDSLVYLSAFAPSKGEHIHDILDDAHKVRKIPGVDGFKTPIVDEKGFIELSEETVVKYFAPDIPEADARLIAVGQGKLHKDALDHAASAAAWENKPSWYVVTTQDQMIAPGVMRLMAEKIGATTTELAASHVSMLSQPEAVAKVILEAAAAN